MTTNLGDSKRGYFGVGSESAPSQTFSNEPVTGIYLDTPGTSSAWTVSKRGTKRLRIDDDKTVVTGPFYASGGIIPTGTILADDGSFSAPSYSFTNETKMGMYRGPADYINITNGTGTTPSLTCNPSGTVVRGALTTGTGSISGGGFFPSSLSVSGTSSFTGSASFGSSGITSAGLIQGADGTISNPEYSFTNDTKMGMYRGGTNILNFSPGTGTLPMLSVISTGCAINGAITTGTNSISGGGINGSSVTSTGIYQGGSGTVTNPEYTFTSGTSSGIYYEASIPAVSVSVSGTRIGSFQPSQFFTPTLNVASVTTINSSGINTGPLTSSAMGCNSIAVSGTSSFTGSTTVGSLTSTTITNSGTASVSGNMTCGGILTTSTGILNNGTTTLVGTLTCSNISSSGINTGTNSLTTGAITSSKNFTNGTNSMTTGALSCSSVTSTGDITWPYYNITVTNTGTQAISSGVVTSVSMTSKITGTNISFSNPQTTFTIPLAGRYHVSFGTTFASNSTGPRMVAAYINGTTFAGCQYVPAVSGDVTRLSSGFNWTFATNDTIAFTVYQASGVSLNIGADIYGPTVLEIDRLHA